ncbi:MAG: YigZ family protein [Ekhidna sp.]|nr:YigZ family protein [Ekhidna sp.]
MLSNFKTIQNKSDGFYKEKGSKFFALAYPIQSENEIRDIQNSLRKEYYDARHHCYAWILGMEKQTWRANDDGEPAHSAGDPILGQIKSHGLTNTLVVVIRYFGGTKLGVGGLIQAYKTATDLALSSAELKEIYETVLIRMELPYEMLSQAERLVNDFQLDVHERDFTNSCIMQAAIRKDLVLKFKDQTSDLYSINFTFSDTN